MTKNNVTYSACATYKDLDGKMCCLTGFSSSEEAYKYAELMNFKIIEIIPEKSIAFDYDVDLDSKSYSELVELSEYASSYNKITKEMYSKLLNRIVSFQNKVQRVLDFRESNPKLDLDIDAITQILNIQKIKASEFSKTEVSEIKRMLKEFRSYVLTKPDVVIDKHLSMKSYDGFSAQTQWYNRGYGPKHGSIDYSIKFSDNKTLIERYKTDETFKLQIAKYIQLHIDDFDNLMIIKEEVK